MSIISQQLEACVRAASSAGLSECRPWGFSLADSATILGFLGATLTAAFFIIRWVALKTFPNKPTKFNTFWGMRRALRRLANENARIFLEFGPNSGADAKGPVRFDLSVWAQAKSRIADNNDTIASIIRENDSRIPARYAALFRSWLSHIDAFAAHVDNPAVDYRHHTFPGEVSRILGSA